MTDLLDLVVASWTTLQLAYFAGTAMWTYLTQPFTFTLPGFESAELEPWQENGERWRRLRVIWPGHLATHSTVQTMYVGDDGLIRREDYDVEILGGSTGAHYMSEYTRVAGIMLPTGHRIFPRTQEARHSPSRCWSRSISVRSHCIAGIMPIRTRRSWLVHGQRDKGS